MRCPNCGFNNNLNNNYCIKCNAQLLSELDNDKSFNNKKLNFFEISNSIDQNILKNDDSMICEKCNYPNIMNAEICINCKTSLIAKKDIVIQNNNEPIELEYIKKGFATSKNYLSIVLPLNYIDNPHYILKSSQQIGSNENDILSKVKLEKKGGKWYIENQNDNIQVFTKLRKKEEIESGDFIILNDGRMLQFNI